MSTTATLPKWNRSPSPKDGKTYATSMKNFIGDEWESTAQADPTAVNGWRNGKWQDYGKEVRAWRPLA
jgi:phosphoribosylaminoimidazole carboxylase (NCAIR synthetase)